MATKQIVSERGQCRAVDPNSMKSSTKTAGTMSADSASIAMAGSHAALIGLPQAGQGMRRIGPNPSFFQHGMTAWPQCGHAERAAVILSADPAGRPRPAG